MSTFQPPPTFALPVITDEHSGKATFNPIWLSWFLQLAQYVSQNSGTNSTIAHNSLQGLQGGASTERYHMTAAQLSALITLLGYGSNGTGTLVHTTGSTGVTFGDTPSVGNAAALAKSSVNMNNGAGSSAATLTNAPAVGNPTKWIPINDNGTTRYIPCW